MFISLSRLRSFNGVFSDETVYGAYPPMSRKLGFPMGYNWSIDVWVMSYPETEEVVI